MCILYTLMKRNTRLVCRGKEIAGFVQRTNPVIWGPRFHRTTCVALQRIPTCVIFTIYVLPFPISSCRVVDQFPILCKARTMTGAVPGMLTWIPFQCAAQVWAALGGGGQQVDDCLKGIDRQLWTEYRSRGGEDVHIRVLFPLDQIAQYHCRNHGGSHAPFVKPGGNI